MSKTHSCCFRGFFLGLISSGLSSSRGSCLMEGGGESAASPGLDVAEMVVEPPELGAPPLPRDSGLFGGEGGELGVDTVRVLNSGFKFFAAFPGVLKYNF